MRATRRVWRRAVSGVEASQLFAAQRRVLLEDLANNTNDKSLAGRVDPLIAPLVSFINDGFSQYVTTSSCSGRIALFHRGRIEDDAAVEPFERSDGTVTAPNAARKRGGFGLGTLFQSHDPLHDVEATVETQLLPTLAAFWAWRQRVSPFATPLTQQTELLQLKFEPMIIHILCRDVEAAAALLQCASESAQGNSGIISCSRGTQEHRKITCCVTSPLTYDIPLFSDGTWVLPVAMAESGDAAERFTGDAWRTLVTRAVHRANALFDENAERTERFRQQLAQRLQPCTEQPVS